MLDSINSERPSVYAILAIHPTQQTKEFSYIIHPAKWSSKCDCVQSLCGPGGLEVVIRAGQLNDVA